MNGKWNPWTYIKKGVYAFLGWIFNLKKGGGGIG